MTSPNPITEAIFGAARRGPFPSRILMHPDTLYNLCYEEGGNRIMQPPMRNAEPYRFCGTLVHHHDDFPPAGFAFQRHCPDCSFYLYYRDPRTLREDHRCVVRNGRYVCATCEGERFVTYLESEEWLAAKDKAA